MSKNCDEKGAGDNDSGTPEIHESPRPTSTNTDVEKLTTEAEKHLDYAGSAAKTDPEEIRLVRKLDLWMLVCCFSRVFCLRIEVKLLTM